ncbi:hypothetical protein CEXT_577941 [Caerostris extrusa]|uniref:SnoaL-like domain-containing protein n=1 Tax=Caerostris extrusa TaxID=172846 RepID=A0AAV4WLW2_CAEEX|nr:hypothetical protein CEXT_577941 [Caerostris extrusa]
MAPSSVVGGSTTGSVNILLLGLRRCEAEETLAGLAHYHRWFRRDDTWKIKQIFRSKAHLFIKKNNLTVSVLRS